MKAALNGDKNISEPVIFGVLSLIIWALLLIVTLKYVVVLLNADNDGEGGTLSLMALAQRGCGKFFLTIPILGIIGAALFYGDAMITPAISVLSAVEGLRIVTPTFDPYILSITLAIIIGLFAVQSGGTARVANLFGPITLVWFFAIAAAGIWHIADAPQALLSVNPIYAVNFLNTHGAIALVTLGAVFLAVTGAEALYADLGHFGKNPIRYAWLIVVLPCLLLNYLGQGAFLLKSPEAIDNPFFLMFPHWALVPIVVLATIATIIASQAVITGAFSMTQQAIQLGLLPRMRIRNTSPNQRGQIYLPQVNWIVMFGVIVLVLAFRTSFALSSAYGIAVTGTMVVTACLAIAGMLILIMWIWRIGTKQVQDKTRKTNVKLAGLVQSLVNRPPHSVPGTAVFFTSDPDTAPTALLHSLKHYKVLA